MATNHFDVDPQCRLRMMVLNFCSLINTIAAWLEDRLFASVYRRFPVPPPLFVLGAARSGTTLLHNLLAQDRRFAFPNLYQIRNPHTFLGTETIMTWLTGSLVLGRRLHDNVTISWETPDEDEFAIMLHTLKTPVVGMLFPKNRTYYEQFITFEKCSKKEIRQWQNALLLFLRKLTWKYGLPLILKSPPHLGRVRLLLELFPQAKFVHIYRHPYNVFRSSYHASNKVMPLWSFQQSTPKKDPIEVWTNTYNLMYEAFFRDKELIPLGHYYELRFEDLEQDPVTHVRKIYQALALPDFQVVEADLVNYVRSISGYKKTPYPELSFTEKKRIAKSCSRNFKEWGYSDCFQESREHGKRETERSDGPGTGRCSGSRPSRPQRSL